MIARVRVTVLSENSVQRRGLLAEHGFAVWIEADDHRILFDTGQGLVLSHNARVLGIDLGKADAVVLSHGHFDHTGGLAGTALPLSGATVFVHPDAFRPRYVRRDGVAHAVESPIRSVDELYSRAGRVVLTAKPAEIRPGLVVSGAIPRQTDFEDTGGAFYLDQDLQRPDPIEDDQALVIRTPEGLVLLIGCAHAGVVNTLNHARRITGEHRVLAVLGGMHLAAAKQERIARTVRALAEAGVARIAPAHCTGAAATAVLASEFPDRYFPCPTGTVAVFP